MAIVTIQTPALNNIQKKRIGEKLLDSLHSEGVPASSIVILFKAEDSDIYLDGGLLIEAKQQPAAVSPHTITTVPKVLSQPAPPQQLPQPSRVAAPVPVPKHQKALPEYGEVKDRVRKMLIDNGAISSFQAQAWLNLKGHDGASAMLRRVFAELELEGIIEKQGQKRGTRYVIKGIASAPPQKAPVILVKSDAKPTGQTPYID
ncbi:MAG: hypothetical protein LBC63_07420 [Holophagales bacterium]|jgi:hypothetical protein|nr:hypothetical protein [Holophagales bacterium]